MNKLRRYLDKLVGMSSQRVFTTLLPTMRYMLFRYEYDKYITKPIYKYEFGLYASNGTKYLVLVIFWSLDQST